MREAIEKVIAELEVEHKRNWEMERKNINREQQYYRQGGQDGLSFAIDKLKAVIADVDLERGKGIPNNANSEKK